jgi:predicted Rossmann-fold nucleotide-binding protein/citrate lyase gamma subunit
MSRLSSLDYAHSCESQSKNPEINSLNEIFRSFIEKTLSKERIEKEIKYIIQTFKEQNINVENIDNGELIAVARARLETLVAFAFKQWIEKHPKLFGIKPWALLGGAAVKEDSKTWESVAKIVNLAAAYNITTATGGGTGVMRAPLLSEKLDLPGITIKLGGLPEEQIQIDTEIEILLETFTIRQSLLLEISNVLIFAPGGVGTMYEFLEAVTLVKNCKYKEDKLLVLLDGEGQDQYWDHAHNQLVKSAKDGLLKFNCKKAKKHLLKVFPELTDYHLDFIDSMKNDQTLSIEQIEDIAKNLKISKDILIDVLLETIYIRIKFGKEHEIIDAMRERDMLPTKLNTANEISHYRELKLSS